MSHGCHHLEFFLMAAAPQPPLNSHSISTIPSPLVGVAQEHLLCPQTATLCLRGFQGRGMGSAQSAPRCSLHRSSHLPLPTNGGDFRLLSSGKPPAKVI